MSHRILLTGSTGFQGSAILRALRLQEATDISLLTRSGPRAWERDRGDQDHHGDIRDEAAVRHATEGVDTIIHAASFIGNNAELSESVNVQGTKNLVQAAARQGVRRLIYLSTTAVYGAGPHRGERPNQLSVAPESELSHSRAAAERIVLGAGGLVIRTSLVFGVGDRWVIPAMIQVVRNLGGLINNGEALLSVIKSDDLGDLVAKLAVKDELPKGEIFHGANINPEGVRRLVTDISDALGLALPIRNTNHDSASLTASSGLTPHQVGLVSVDHWYRSDSLWDASGLTSPEKFVLSETEIEWYRSAAGPTNDKSRVSAPSTQDGP